MFQVPFQRLALIFSSIGLFISNVSEVPARLNASPESVFMSMLEEKEIQNRNLKRENARLKRYMHSEVAAGLKEGMTKYAKENDEMKKLIKKQAMEQEVSNIKAEVSANIVSGLKAEIDKLKLENEKLKESHQTTLFALKAQLEASKTETERLKAANEEAVVMIEKLKSLLAAYEKYDTDSGK